MRGVPTFSTATLAAVLAFLYGPILLVVLFSFNASRLVTVWGGFSTHWYGSLWTNGPLLDAAGLSLRVALLSAAGATVIGTLAALALARSGRGLGSFALSAAIYVPLVTPEVITGLSLLLLFVALGLERGFWTVVLAHTVLGVPFVAVLVRAKLATLPPLLEEAAADLGASPAAIVRTVILPLAWPAVAAGFLLAFTISLDDLVVTSFASGPGATTLPMRIYSQVRLGVTPEINAVATLLIAVAGLAVLLATAASGMWRRRGSRRQRAPAVVGGR